ncbi:hypothetical protein ATCC90586_011667 [Pythium insidiosum]|nr:hypothetical protein ATCC90586_011667 [Pythium insidiosum]
MATPTAAAAATHNNSIALDAAATDRLFRHHSRPLASTGNQTSHAHARLQRDVRHIVESTGNGFIYGTLFGGVLAAVEGYRESPQHQRLRGIIHHARAVIPATAGRIAVVTCLFRVAVWGLESARGQQQADWWDVALAAPIAGALLKIRHGPRAAMRNAVMFGSVGAVMVAVNSVERRVRKHDGESPEEVLEEIAFAEEVEE